jgi:hypothetical protein
MHNSLLLFVEEQVLSVARITQLLEPGFLTPGKQASSRN